MNEEARTPMKLEGNRVVLYPEGRIDSGNAGALASAVEAALREHPGMGLTLDLEKLTYISSAGLRVLLSAAKRLKELLEVRNASLSVYDILDVTGFTQLMKVTRQMREIDVEGCEVIGRGAYGTVYRIDPDTIVKVYNTPNALEMIENEQSCAKKAFLKGVPTAISYDAVRVGDGYGSVFELVNAKTFNDLLIEEPQNADAVIDQYADIVRQVHAIEVEPGELPDCRDAFLRYVDAIAGHLSSEAVSRLRALFQAMPEDRHMIHGDLHLKNVMLSGDEPILIDMDTLSMGDPVFDYAGIYVAYKAFCEDDPDNSMAFMGIPQAMSDRIWERTMALCLDAPDPETRRDRMNRVQIVADVRFLYLLGILGSAGDALTEARVRRARRRLEALLPGVEGLAVR